MVMLCLYTSFVFVKIGCFAASVYSENDQALWHLLVEKGKGSEVVRARKL